MTPLLKHEHSTGKGWTGIHGAECRRSFSTQPKPKRRRERRVGDASVVVPLKSSEPDLATFSSSWQAAGGDTYVGLLGVSYFFVRTWRHIDRSNMETERQKQTTCGPLSKKRIQSPTQEPQLLLCGRVAANSLPHLNVRGLDRLPVGPANFHPHPRGTRFHPVPNL